MYRPPRRSTADGGAGMWNPPSAAVPFGQNAQGRFDPEAHRFNGEFDSFGVGLMREWFLPQATKSGWQMIWSNMRKRTQRRHALVIRSLNN